MAKVPGGKQVGAVSIRVLPNATKFRDDLRLLLKRVEGSMSANLRVEADTTRAAASVQRFRNQIERNPVNLQVDTTAATRAVQKLRKELRDNDGKLRVDADTKLATAQVARVARDRAVNLRINLNQASVAKAVSAIAALSGARLITSTFGDIGNALANVDKNLPKIALVATSVASLVSVLFSAIGGIAGVGSSLASLLALAAPVPGLLAAAGVAGITLAVALSAAKTQLESLQPVWSSLKATIQDNFWARAQQPILDLVNGVFPQLTDGLAAVSNSLGAWAASVAGSFQAAFGGGQLATLMGLLATSIDNSTVGTDAFAQSIATLGLFSAQYLPSIGKWFSDISVQFNGWITTVTQNGQLTAWVERAMDVVGQLGTILQSTVQVFASVDAAAVAAGGGGLAAFTAGMVALSEIVSGPAFQKALTTIFEGANAGLDALAPGIARLLGVIGDLAPSISSVLTLAGEALGGLLTNIAVALQEPAFAQGLTAFFSGIKIGLDSIGPALPSVARALGTLGSVVGTLAATLGPVLGAALEAVAPLLSEILTQIQPLIPLLGDALISAIQQLAPAFMQIATEVLPPLIDAITTLIPLLPSLASFLAELLVQVAPVAAQLLESLLPAFEQMTPAIISLLTAVTPLLEYLPLMATQVQILAGVISTVLAVAFTIMQTIWLAFTALITGDWSNFAEKISSITSGLGSSLGSIWSGIVSSMTGVIASLLSQALRNFSNFRDSVIGVFSGAGRWLYDSGVAIIQGLADGIRSAVGRATAAVSGVLQSVRNFLPFSPAKEGPFSGKGWTLYSGKAIGNALADGMLSTTSNVRSAANRLATSAYVGGTGGVNVSQNADGRAAVALPDTIALLDEDGSILTKAKVIADNTVSADDDATRVGLENGKGRR